MEGANNQETMHLLDTHPVGRALSVSLPFARIEFLLLVILSACHSPIIWIYMMHLLSWCSA